jgi:hypothetical protein
LLACVTQFVSLVGETIRLETPFFNKGLRVAQAWKLPRQAYGSRLSGRAVAFFLALILGAISVALLFYALRRTPKQDLADLPDTPPLRLQGRRWCDFEIAGENHYQAALAAIGGVAPQGDAQGANYFCDALLIPETDRPSASHAVTVVIDGLRVGHLKSKDGADYLARLKDLGVEPALAACPAYVFGGSIDEDGVRAPYVVRLGLAWPVQLEAKVEPPPPSPRVAARLRGEPLSEEDAWHYPPVRTIREAEFRQMMSGGVEDHAVCFAGWSVERIDYMGAVARSVGLRVCESVEDEPTLMVVGPTPPDEDLERAKSQGVTLISGDQLQELVAQITSAPQ